MSAPQLPWWTRPVPLGLLGLAVAIAGWKLSVYSPPPPPLVEELRRMTDDDALRAKLTPRPYELPGRLLFFAGVALFGVAGVRMFRRPAEEAPEQAPEVPQETPPMLP